jgi:16S rRNA C1402 N4-methylase RsmH
MSTRRTFQALGIAVNDELSALDALLRSLPLCLTIARIKALSLIPPSRSA